MHLCRCYSDTAPLKPKIPTSRISRDIEPEAFSAPYEGRDKKTVEMTPEIQKLLLKKCPPSACYRDLHNNTSVHLFAYPDFSFPKDTPNWSPHQVTGEYFQNYAEKFDLLPLIEFNTSVDLVTKNKQDDTWELSLIKYDVYPSGLVRVSRWKESFDAVVGASGLHQEPYVPDFKDLTAWNKMWPDKASHSNQFRRPEDFLGKVLYILIN
jgi:cation diffusion facilitator CzcD-associated flavoprotein CzcO